MQREHRGSSREESEEDSEGGGCKCERETSIRCTEGGQREQQRRKRGGFRGGGCKCERETERSESSGE